MLQGLHFTFSRRYLFFCTSLLARSSVTLSRTHLQKDSVARSPSLELLVESDSSLEQKSNLNLPKTIPIAMLAMLLVFDHAVLPRLNRQQGTEQTFRHILYMVSLQKHIFQASRDSGNLPCPGLLSLSFIPSSSLSSSFSPGSGRTEVTVSTPNTAATLFLPPNSL